ncbi:hypothetical protein Amet_4360 [Alkaliphilus metalliredigens QYMF]|uniref:Uncharacterized protein n=1 Tax=Alkaliphilus metalliredigens (strain QYMF) TaxID=293826 RepID=A6TKD1_ALKMQ|nr:hypothetical protein [Alkaliphilus metalliredigens]ABR46649.1 hypothetical protein Amet_0421 [Alkaliphilus metalliredigens QYMF]ABR48121.1 hypothetical protein Amet_1958 [Alkaliphilus metalliredigens QYMF]ABR50434.1 hypothetical protein Amet_4360 [Alkaliphilus metalliredigens QYMF]
MEITVINNSKFIKHVGEVTLNIGANEVEKKDWDKESKHPIVKDWLKDKVVEVKEGLIEDISEITPAGKAIEIVQTTFSQEKLQKWSEQEERKTVLEAIQKQLKEAIKSGE